MKLKFLLLIFVSNLLLADSTENLYPDLSPPTGVSIDSAKKGEYLVKAGDCIACHTPEGAKPFSGGLPIKTPFGTYYSPNLTPDKATGLGNWTEADFVRALKHGVAPDGSYYFPVFPYIYYNKISDQDAKDIWAYFRSIPAVNKPNKPIDAPLPFRIRASQFFWRLAYFHPFKGDYKYDKKQSKEWNRGAYLAYGLGHCGMCHTPINLLGAPKRNQSFTGSVVDGYAVPNITGVTLADVSVDQIVRIFAYDELPGGGKVQGPMQQVNHDSLMHLQQDDLQALAVFLKSLKPRYSKKALAEQAEMAGKAGADVNPKAVKIYQTYCSACHSIGAGGAPKTGDSASWAPHVAKGKETLYKNAINGINAMPAMGACPTCTDDDIKITVDYILDMLPKDGHSMRKLGKAPAKPTLVRGQEIYEQVCSTCHADGKMGAPVLGDQNAWSQRLKNGILPLIRYALETYKPSKSLGVCATCDDTDIIAAVKYMVNQSQPQGKDYALW